MSEDQKKGYSQSGERPFIPNEQHDKLRAARVESIMARVASKEQPNGLTPFLFSGEILFFADFQDGQFMPKRLARIALHGQPESVMNSSEPAELHTIDIVGPLDNVPVDIRQDSDTGSWIIEGFPCRLYHSQLKLKKGEDEDDVFFPNIEIVISHLVFQENDDSQEEKVILDIETIQFQLAEGSGIVTDVVVEPVTLVFGGPGRPDEAYEQHHSLQPCAPTVFQLPPCQSPNHNAYEREVALKFFNLTKTFDMNEAQDKQDLEDLCQLQIDQCCDIWGRQGSLSIQVDGTIHEASQGDKLSAYNAARARGLFQKTDYTASSEIKVFIVEKLILAGGGDSQGATYYAGTSNAYIVLDLRALQGSGGVTKNQNLLAHELCHAIGLNHPGDTSDVNEIPGSANSIAAALVPNSDDNSLHNCTVFTSAVLNSLVKLVTTPGGEHILSCFRPNIG